MPRFDVKCWITVTAKDERDAERVAADVLDTVAEDYRGDTAVEGEGAVYEVEEYD